MPMSMDATKPNKLPPTPDIRPRRLGLPPILVGPRLVLVSYDNPGLSSPEVIAQWSDPWFNMVTDPEVMRFLAQGGVQFMTDKSDFPKYLEDRTIPVIEGKAANYVVLRPKDPRFLSSDPSPFANNAIQWTPDHFALVGIGGIPREICHDDGSLSQSGSPRGGGVRRAEVGIILDKVAHGHGYAHEIMHLVLEALFNRNAAVEFQEAWWRTLDGNVGMRAWCSSVMPHVQSSEWVSKPDSLKGTWVEYVLTRHEYNKVGGVREAIREKMEKAVARGLSR